MQIETCMSRQKSLIQTTHSQYPIHFFYFEYYNTRVQTVFVFSWRAMKLKRLSNDKIGQKMQQSWSLSDEDDLLAPQSWIKKVSG